METDGSLSGKIEGTGRNSFSWQGSETEKTFVQEASELSGDPILRIDGIETLDPDTGAVELALTIAASKKARFRVEDITVDSLTVDGEEMSFPITFAPGTFQVAVSGGMH